MELKELLLKRKVHINKKTGQPSITLPKKKFKAIGKIPKEIEFKVKKIKW